MARALDDHLLMASHICGLKERSVIAGRLAAYDREFIGHCARDPAGLLS
jgi:hypothetical protein